MIKVTERSIKRGKSGNSAGLPRQQEPAEMKGRIKWRRKRAARRIVFQKFATNELYQAIPSYSIKGRQSKGCWRSRRRWRALCIIFGQTVHWDDGQLSAEDHAEADAIISSYAIVNKRVRLRLRHRDRAVKREGNAGDVTATLL